MRKSAYVLDTPANCQECMFSEFVGPKLRCRLIKEGDNDVHALARAYGCPLTDLPDRDPPNPEIEPNVYYTSRAYAVYKDGWNSCLDKIGR